jgi:hypothetical protein
MRHPYKTLLVVALVVSACAGITVLYYFMAESDTTEWDLLFDGKTVSGWQIEGDHEIVQGALVLGGKRVTRAYFPLAVVRNCEIRFQYRTEGKEGAELGWDSRKVPGVGIRHFSPKADWHDSFIVEYADLQHFRQRFIKGQHGANGVFAPIDALWIEVPAGSKLFLRNIRLHQSGNSHLPWLLAFLLAIGSLMVLIRWRWRKKRQRCHKTNLGSKILCLDGSMRPDDNE